MLHEALKNVRKFHGATIEETAKKLGVSLSYISELENGHKRIHVDILEGYSKAFDMPVSSICFLAEQLENSSQGRGNFAARKISSIIRWIGRD